MVALVFLVFEVELAFFFPWATVAGKLTRLGSPDLPAASADALGRSLGLLDHDLADLAASPGKQAATGIQPADARRLALAAMADIALFFAVLMVGFAYVWYRGDLNWVRAIGPSTRLPTEPPRQRTQAR